MIFDLPANDPRLALFLCQQLRILWNNGDSSLIGANILAETGESNSQQFFPPSTRFPAYHIVWSPQRAYIFVLGCSSFAHGQNCFNNYITEGYDREVRGVGVYYADFARQVLRDFGDNPYSYPLNWVITGHSLGGAIMPVLHRLIRETEPITNIISVSFGAPKSKFYGSRTDLPTSSVVRWMRQGDPVPSFPPNFSPNIRAALSMTPNQYLGYCSWLHAGEGIVVDAFGITQPFVNTNVDTAGDQMAIAQWLFDIWRQRQTNHDLDGYQAALTLTAQRILPPTNARVVSSGPDLTPAVTRHEVARSTDLARAAIVHVGNAQNAASLVVPKTKAFGTIKIAGVWWVRFGDSIVACGHTRKRAGLMARYGNLFLHRLHRMSAVDINGVTGVLAGYLDEASKPDNGFSPPIATFGS